MRAIMKYNFHAAIRDGPVNIGAFLLAKIMFQHPKGPYKRLQGIRRCNGEVLHFLNSKCEMSNAE